MERPQLRSVVYLWIDLDMAPELQRTFKAIAGFKKNPQTRMETLSEAAKTMRRSWWYFVVLL